MSSTEQSPRSYSQAGSRRPGSRSTDTHRTLLDCQSEVESTADSPSLGQRSVSLATIPPTIIQPRMAQLETLEAKMASIEVSLSSTPRRKKNGSLSGISLGSSIRSIPKEVAAKELESLRNALRDKENIIQSLKGQLTIPGLRLNGIKNCSNNNNLITNNKELSDTEKKQAEDRLNRLKTDVDNKRLTIKNLKMALERLDITDNIDVRIQQAELEYQLGREELNLLTLLEETRALQLCIEESNKNSSENHTLYSCVEGGEYVILRAIELNHDPKSPKFGAGQRDATPGLWVEWALEETGLSKGDRLIEVNGKIVVTKTRDDLTRLLAAAPDPAQIVILRKLSQNETVIPFNSSSKEVSALRSELEVIKERAEEAQRTKEGLRSDNIRLTHRISYLEEQVSELLTRKSPDDIRIMSPTPVVSSVKSNQNITNINITSQSPSSTADLQVFQKGSQMTTLMSNNSLESKDSPITLPIRSKSSLSNVSNTHIPAPTQNADYHCKNQYNRSKHRSRNGIQSPICGQNVDLSEKITYRKHNHHHHHREKCYNSETNSTVDQMTRYNKKKHENHRYSAEFANTNSDKEYSGDIMDQSYKKATKIVHELTRSRDTALYEKHRQKCLTASEKYNTDILKHYNARKSTSVLDFRSEIHIGPKYSDSKSVENLDVMETIRNDRMYKKIQDSRSVKSLDFDSDCNSTTNSCRGNGQMKTVDYTSEPTNDNRKLSCYYDNSAKPRPTPPKKPLRLSLHKTHSLQSVENSSDGQGKGERKSVKRNYRGEIPIINLKNEQHNEVNGREMNGQQQKISWNFRRGTDNSLENGSWC